MATWAPLLSAAALLSLVALPASAQESPKTPAAVDAYNAVIGTQTIGPSYQFSDRNWLLETARAVLAMGSNTIMFALDVPKPLHGGPAASAHTLHTLADVARLDPSVRAVLNMPFANYVLWAYPRGIQGDQFHPGNLAAEYREMYGLTRTLLTAYDGTGKTFYLGNWEGDWHLLHTNMDYFRFVRPQ